MSTRTRAHGLTIFAVLFIVLPGAFALHSEFGSRKNAPTLQGEQAVAQLSRQGLDTSLREEGREAVTASQLTIDPMLAQVAKLSVSDGAASDAFGSAIAISGETVVIGASAANNSRGAAYVFVGNGAAWTEQARLTTNDNAVFTGASASISGETIVVSSSGGDSAPGAASLFVRNGTTWTQQQKPTADTLTVNAPPTITAGAAVNLPQSGSVTGATIATVADAETPLNNLNVTLMTVPAGLTINNLTNTDGTITADLAAACTAPAGANSVVLKVTDANDASATVNLTVNVITASASISTQPVARAVCPGSVANFAVAATGTVPLTYQWRKNGAPIKTATSSAYLVSATTTDDAGDYDVVISGACSTALTSSVARLIVNPVTLLTSQPVNVVACPGQPATFSVTATGTALSYQWRKNGANIVNATASSFTINQVTSDDPATYEVVINGSCGNATSTAAALTVNTLVSVTTQPASQSISIGAPASFTVAAAGTGPFTYQWRKSGSNLSDDRNVTGTATATLNLAAVAASDARSYEVIVTGACGAVTSQAAQLTAVNDAPVAGFGSALQFPGNNQSYGSVAIGPNLNGATAFTVEAWVNPVDLSSRYEILTRNPFYFNLQNGRPSVYLGGTSNPGYHTSATAVKAGVWSHVAATWDGSTVKIYLNGTEMLSASDSGSLSSADGFTLMGVGRCVQCADTATGFNGLLDEVRLWSVNRSATELQFGMFRGMTGAETGLVACYRCDEAGGTTLFDATGHGFNATLAGAVSRVTEAANSITTNEDTPASGRLFGYDVNGDALTYSLVAQSSKGTVLITDASTGAFTWTPNANTNGTDSFTFSVSDGALDSSVASVTITITASNDSPTITAGAASSVTQAGSITGANIATVSDVETAAGNLTVTAMNLPAGLSVSHIVNTAGTITASIAASCHAITGVNTIELKVTDGDGGAATTSLTINVTPDAAPVVIAQPTAQIGSVGGSASFTAAARGANTAQWQVSTDRGATFNDLDGATSVTLTLSKLTFAQHGNRYRAVFASACRARTTEAAELIVNKLASVIAVTASANPSTINQPVTFTTTVTGPGGTPAGSVEFFDGTSSLATVNLNNGAASLTISILVIGPHAITVVYRGSDSYQPGTSVAMNQVINAACTFAVAPAAPVVAATGGTLTASVTTRSDCAWSAASNMSWIVIDQGSSGAGNGAVTYSVLPHNGSTNRIGTLTVAGQTITVTQGKPLAVVSAASFDGTTITSDEIVSAFGADLSATTETANSLPLPQTLGGITVKIIDSVGVERFASLLFISPLQINFITPAGMAPGAATVVIVNGMVETSAAAIQVADIAPAIFTANASGTGLPAAQFLRVRADGASSYEPVAQFDAGLNQYLAVPVDLGTAPGATTDEVFLILFGTGVRHRNSEGSVAAKIGDVAAEVLYAGAQGSLVGLDQLNLRIPRSLIGRGEANVVVTIDGQSANVVRINIR